MSNFGAYLVALREKKEMARWAVHRATGVSYGYLSSLEKGDNDPTPEILRKISKGLEVPYFDLLEAAGYVGPDDIDLIKNAIKERFEPLFNNKKIVDLLYDPDVLSILNIINGVKDEAEKEKMVAAIKAIAMGWGR